MLLDGAAGDQVGQQHLVGLADSVQAAQPLLDLHRVPRQVHVHHHVAELQVAPLSGGFGGEQDRGLVAERGYRPLLIRARQAAVVDHGRDARCGQVPGHLIEGLPECGENQDLLPAPCEPTELVEQHRGLGRGAKGLGTGGQVIPADLGQRGRGGGRT